MKFCMFLSLYITEYIGLAFGPFQLDFSMRLGVGLWETAPPARFYDMLGQTHVNGWSRVFASQNGGSTSYIFPLRLGVLQWSRHLFNYLDK